MSTILTGDKMYYIKRHNKGILLKDSYKEEIISIGIKSYLNRLCMQNLSTFDGRRKATVKLLHQSNNTPIFINNDIFVYPTKSLREFDMLYINYHEVLSFKSIDSDNTLLIFNNLEQLVVNVSIKKVIKQHRRVETIIQYIDNIS